MGKNFKNCRGDFFLLTLYNKNKIVGYYVNTTVEHYDNVFVHKGGKLEKRQFLAKMHQIAPNCVSNFKIFPGVTPPDPQPWGHQTSPPLGA